MRSTQVVRTRDLSCHLLTISSSVLPVGGHCGFSTLSSVQSQSLQPRTQVSILQTPSFPMMHFSHHGYWASSPPKQTQPPTPTYFPWLVGALWNATIPRSQEFCLISFDFPLPLSLWCSIQSQRHTQQLLRRRFH